MQGPKHRIRFESKSRGDAATLDHFVINWLRCSVASVGCESEAVTVDLCAPASSGLRRVWCPGGGSSSTSGHARVARSHHQGCSVLSLTSASVLQQRHPPATWLGSLPSATRGSDSAFATLVELRAHGPSELNRADFVPMSRLPTATGVHGGRQPEWPVCTT